MAGSSTPVRTTTTRRGSGEEQRQRDRQRHAPNSATSEDTG